MAIRGLRPQAVLLDALGTLVELQPPAPRLRTELRERLGLRVSEAQARHAIAAEIAYYRAHLDQGRDAASLAALRSRCAEVLGQTLERSVGHPVPTGVPMVGVLLASLRFRAYCDVAGALAELRRLGVRLVVVSNWDISLPTVLAALGVSCLLDGVVTSAEVGARKPERAVFERGLELAGVGARDAMHVGDSPVEDVQGARQAGIEPLLIRRRGATVLPDLAGQRTIRSLGELPALISGHGRRASDLL